MPSFALATFLAVMAFAEAATADDTSACIAASEAGQSLRDHRSLLEARDKFAACSKDVCPRPVRADCMQQRSEVEAAIPTVVARAKDARGEDAVDAKVLCDGVVLAAQLDGKARPVNPGPHVFRFEIAGTAPFERKVVVAEGEKNRLVLGEAPREAVATPSPETPDPQSTGSSSAVDTSSTSPSSEASAGADRRGVSIPGLIVGSIGVAAAVPMAILWLSGTGDLNNMRGTCAPSAGGAGCPSSRVTSDRTQLILGDVFLGVSVVGLATGAILLLTHGTGSTEGSTGSTASVRIDGSPLPGGAYVSALGSF